MESVYRYELVFRNKLLMCKRNVFLYMLWMLKGVWTCGYFNQIYGDVEIGMFLW